MSQGKGGGICGIGVVCRWGWIVEPKFYTLINGFLLVRHGKVIMGNVNKSDLGKEGENWGGGKMLVDT